MQKNRQIVLAAHPSGPLSADHFRLQETPLQALNEGEFLIRNQYLALDAGFRQWMNAGSGDNYLPAMQLGNPVQSIVLGQVIESRNADYPAGTTVMGRTAWEEYSIADGSDLMTVLAPEQDIPLAEYLCALGPAGMTAYFGLLDIGNPTAGETVVVSAAAGGVGSIVGQIARIKGCQVLGITSSEEKASWLRNELGYHGTLNYRREPGLLTQLQTLAPQGIDIFFDNVGGTLLDTCMQHLAEGARLVLCGAISQYDHTDRHDPVYNLWQLITKRARVQGFMFSDYIDRYPAAMADMAAWIREGKLKSPVTISRGIEATPAAFCDMLSGKSRGKCLVRLEQP